RGTERPRIELDAGAEVQTELGESVERVGREAGDVQTAEHERHDRRVLEREVVRQIAVQLEVVAAIREEPDEVPEDAHARGHLGERDAEGGADADGLGVVVVREHRTERRLRLGEPGGRSEEREPYDHTDTDTHGIPDLAMEYEDG